MDKYMYVWVWSACPYVYLQVRVFSCACEYNRVPQCVGL